MHRYNDLLAEISGLPDDWHKAGHMGERILNKIVQHAENRRIANSAETGTGRTTLLLSHMSSNHTVFAYDDALAGGSLSAVQSSPLLNNNVEFVLGPTQVTLRNYKFKDKLQLVLLDGPHGYPFPEIEYWCFYPHIDEGGLLIIDDIHIPTIHNLVAFLKEEAMFDFVDQVSTTAFFRRNATQLFDPYGDGWQLQNYNKKRFPIGFYQKLAALIPLVLQRKILSFLYGRKQS
jgi:methyltransferase family protein